MKEKLTIIDDAIAEEILKTGMLLFIKTLDFKIFTVKQLTKIILAMQ